jgi:hypothetical protein
MSTTKTMNHAEYQAWLKKLPAMQLWFIIKDCKKVLEVWPDYPNHGYYLDEIHYCGMELKKRGVE